METAITNSQADDIKNEYSTFIEELEDTTEKLIDEVFNVPYEPDISEDPETRNHTRRNYKFTASKMVTDPGNMTESFKGFLRRN